MSRGWPRCEEEVWHACEERMIPCLYGHIGQGPWGVLPVTKEWVPLHFRAVAQQLRPCTPLDRKSHGMELQHPEPPRSPQPAQGVQMGPKSSGMSYLFGGWRTEEVVHPCLSWAPSRHSPSATTPNTCTTRANRDGHRSLFCCVLIIIQA